MLVLCCLCGGLVGVNGMLYDCMCVGNVFVCPHCACVLRMFGEPSLYMVCGWQIHVLVYCLSVINAHLRYTQRAYVLHLMDACSLVHICFEHRLPTQTVRVFVSPGFDSTSPAFVTNRACPKTSNRAPFLGKEGRQDLLPFSWRRQSNHL